MWQGMEKCYGEPSGHEAGYGGYSQGKTYRNLPFHDPTSKNPFQNPFHNTGFLTLSEKPNSDTRI